ENRLYAYSHFIQLLNIFK
ncbi:Aminopeptidase N, partial [Haemophilus influenzae]